ncbi:hypothetical protein ABZT43_12320 [Streptomyces sp. NPDC005349]|uniref:hypothetical protein n=1 Tax=Streptomyces sp. NPDC005349 TaxID=3157037 RepID=UPI0033A1DBB8
MSTTVLIDADLAVSELGKARRARMTVDVQIVDAYLAARADGDRKQMQTLRRNAAALDPTLLAEFDGFDYPAAA